MATILIVDDEPQLRTLLSRIISLEGYQVLQADSIRSGRKQIEQHQPDIVLCDVFLPDGNGVEFIQEFKSLLPSGALIMLTAHGNIADGVRAIKNGAYDYLTKGDDNDRIIPLLAHTCQHLACKKEQAKIESLLNKAYTFDSIIGQSKPLLSAVELAKKVAPTDATILLTGETGTGKEVFAAAIHKASNRAKNTFVAVNCGALSGEILESELFGHQAGAFTGATKDKKGLFEQADCGTIFLDEVGEMSPALQVKLLRVLETGEFISVGDTRSKKVNVRVIAATNKTMKESVEGNEFRQDLFYRLSVFTIELPPLRQRGGDILLLAKSFADGFACKMGRSIGAMEDRFVELLQKHAWPGNIRELRNAIERSVILCSGTTLQASDLPIEIQLAQGVPLDWAELASVEKSHICRILHHTAGNKTEAARLMKIGLTTLYRKIDEYGIVAP